MLCPVCSADNPAENRHCENCGVRLGVLCANCGYRNSRTASFCGSCGAALVPGPEVGSVRLNRARLGAERKYATVLFADIVGSTELIAGLDPEQAMEHLRPAVMTMCETIERFDGTVVRTLGDGIMALFGAPRAQEGHALLACESALAVQDAFHTVEGGLTLRVGLHSGDVVSDPQVSALVKEQGAHGATIHLASRLQNVADPGGICITDACYRLVRPYCDVRPLGKHALRGFGEPIEIYALLGLKPAIASQQFRGMKLTSFRGREHEMEALQRALQDAEDGDSHVIGISGDPGTGKSRLCYEFAEWCRGRLIPVLEARALPYGHATPLQPVLELLRLFFRILPTDSIVAARARIAESISEFGSALDVDLPLLCEFLGLATDVVRPLQLPPKARHARLLEIVRHIVKQVGANTAVVIVEDLHWLDEASEDFVRTLVDAIDGTRIMLVLNYRPSYTAPWMSCPYYQQFSLAELSPSETDALVEELIGTAPELRDIRRRIADRSAGNVFFAEELVRSLAENCSLVGEVGNYRFGLRTSDGPLPPTVQAVIGARIDRLADTEKSILQISAVIGKEYPLTVLEDVAGDATEEIGTILDRLCESELLKHQLGADGHHYAFRHPLIQEVAYASQLKARRSSLHASVAQAMERHYKDRIDEFAALIAYHFEAAGQCLNAANYAKRAAMWVGSTNSAQAIKHWRKVRQLLQDQPRSSTNDNLRITASSQIAWLGWREGMTAESAKPYIEEALGWARETDDTMIPMLLFLDGRITL
ncbi:MAG TPA: adenylate/guanylate cyclase domain-containing protein, partial [Stellaceae bacterium]|nr:adenylate/guanylate cyclase domain-containing protein [Stellaceae bacterium]